MAGNQPGPDHDRLTGAYRQAGYTIKDTPGFQGADAAALWVAHDGQPIAVITVLGTTMRPGVLLRNVNQLSRHARIHIVTPSQRKASRVRETLQNPVQRRTDCGVQCYVHPARFDLAGTHLAVSEPHVWIAATDEQSPPNGTVLSVPVSFATPDENETAREDLAVSTSEKRPGYESTVTELKPTETPPETSNLVRTPVITDQREGDSSVVLTDFSTGTLTAYNPARDSALDPRQQEQTPPQVLGDAPWELSPPPALPVTRLHLVAQSNWEDK
jgi:hypothetical protein